MIGIQNIDTTARIRVKTRPIIRSSQSFALGLSFFQISIVNMALPELKTDVRDDINAAITTANIRPRAPIGIKSITNFGYAKLVQPISLPHIRLHSAALAQTTSSK